jgi:hypothetical protein
MTIAAHGFTAPIQGTRFAFGLDRVSTAKALRSLADEFEQGKLTLESVRVQSLASAEDFAVTLLRLKFYEPRVSDGPSYEVPAVPL